MAEVVRGSSWSCSQPWRPCSHPPGATGRFQATRAVYRWNGEVSDDKLVRSAVMWGLLILPVYYVGGLADLPSFSTPSTTGKA